MAALILSHVSFLPVPVSSILPRTLQGARSHWRGFWPPEDTWQPGEGMWPLSGVLVMSAVHRMSPPQRMVQPTMSTGLRRRPWPRPWERGMSASGSGRAWAKALRQIGAWRGPHTEKLREGGGGGEGRGTQSPEGQGICSGAFAGVWENNGTGIFIPLTIWTKNCGTQVQCKNLGHRTSGPDAMDRKWHEQ